MQKSMKASFDRVARDDGPTLFLDQLDLERLTAVAEVRHGVRLRHHLALVAQVAGGQVGHLPLDRLEVLGDERAVHDEVVEEAVVDGRPDAALRLGKECRHRGSEQMCGAVPVERQSLRGVGGDEADLGVGVEGIRQIDHPSVDHRRQRVLGEAGCDSRRQLRCGSAGGQTSRGSIRQRDGDLTHTVAVTAGRAATVWNMVGTGGLEPPTSCMSSRRSNQLSYAPPFIRKHEMIVHVAARRQPGAAAPPTSAGIPGAHERTLAHGPLLTAVGWYSLENPRDDGRRPSPRHVSTVPNAGEQPPRLAPFLRKLPRVAPPRDDCVEVETPELHRVCPSCLRLQLDGRCEPEMPELGAAFPGTDG